MTLNTKHNIQWPLFCTCRWQTPSPTQMFQGHFPHNCSLAFSPFKHKIQPPTYHLPRPPLPFKLLKSSLYYIILYYFIIISFQLFYFFTVISFLYFLVYRFDLLAWLCQSLVDNKLLNSGSPICGFESLETMRRGIIMPLTGRAKKWHS